MAKGVAVAKFCGELVCASDDAFNASADSVSVGTKNDGDEASIG